jgi:hypothetical protein
MEGSTDHSTEWAAVASTLACGLLVCVAAIGASYIVLRAWPRRHYPRFFSSLAGVITVAVLYIMQVPGAGFGLVVLLILIIISLFGLLAEEEGTLQILFKRYDGAKSHPVQQVATSTADLIVWPLLLGLLIGVLLTTSGVAAVIIPPAYVLKWARATEPLGERIERALNPGDQWVALQTKERDESERITRSEAELADIKKRLTEAEMALAKARDELGAATSNTIRGIRISDGNGSRHANGAIYIGVSYTYGFYCRVHASSDKVDDTEKELYPGQAISLASSRGKYRIILTSLESHGCVFDLVKD